LPNRFEISDRHGAVTKTRIGNINPSAARDAAELIKLARAFGLHPYKVENDYWARNYIVRRKASRPTRLKEAIQGETVVVFSRKDVETL